jgi:von Willebrand factor type A domain/von Willebrand factor type A C-terminal domain
MAQPSAPERHHEPDRGTRLGVGTRILTAVVAAPLWIARWLDQISRTSARLVARGAAWIVRACASVGRTVASVLWRVARRVNRAIAWCTWSLRNVLERSFGRIAHALASWAHSLAVAIGAFLGSVGRALRQAAQVVVEPIARRLRALGATLARIARSLAPFWQLTVTLATRLVRGIASLFGVGVTACARTARWIGVWALRVLYTINVAIARARAQHALGIDEPSDVEHPPAVPTGDSALSCSIDVYQNPYLPRGGTTVDVIVTVSAAGFVETARDLVPERAEVILVDCSGSMGKPWRKIRSARMATTAAIEALPDGTWFAIVRANHDAQVVYPRHGGLVRKTPETMNAVHRARRLLWPEGGTAMGRWLVAARELFALRPGAIAHAILLTDGHNEGETPNDLALAVERCVGSFQCDCRGVGDDWDVEELRRISSALLGTVDIVREPEQLTAEFTAMTELAMGRSVNDVGVRVWTPRGAEVVFVRQVAPGLEDLTARRTDLDDLVGEYPTGAWGEETRDYHLRIRVPARQIGERMLAGRVALAVDGNVAAEGRVLAEWTDDEELSTQLHPEAAHATGQADLADAIHHGLEAVHARDTEGATHHLGRAVKLAHEAGDTVRLDQLRTIVDVDDAVTGTVHLRDDPRTIDLMTLDASSTKTVRRTGSSPPNHARGSPNAVDFASDWRASRLTCADGQPT